MKPPEPEEFTIPADRLDRETIRKLIYLYFYNGPVGGASQRLATILRNHLLGVPLMSFEEVLSEFLREHFRYAQSDEAAEKEARSKFWRGINRVEGYEGEFDILDVFEDYARRKSLYECIEQKVAEIRTRGSRTEANKEQSDDID